MSESPWRVALLALVGWSHAFLTEKSIFLYPDTTVPIVFSMTGGGLRLLARLSAARSRIAAKQRP